MPTTVASETSDDEQQLREAWDAFTDSLKALGHDALASAPNAVERADGLRFILRQLAYREEQFLEFPSGHTPELFFAESPTRKVFADCPDTIYHQFSMAPGGRYRISGTRGASPYISFTAYRAGVVDRVVADLHDGEIEIAADRISGVLGLLGLGLSFVNDATVRLSQELRLRPNTMNEAAAELVSEMAGTPHNHYQLSYVKLEPGQALRLDLDPPACRYWSVHLNNWWLESPEFRDGQSVCINDAQAERGSDGTITMLVGPDDPGTGSWLDTKGRTETILLARYLLPEDELPPIVTNLITI